MYDTDGYDPNAREVGAGVKGQSAFSQNQSKRCSARVGRGLRSCEEEAGPQRAAGAHRGIRWHLGWVLFRRRITSKDPAMILVDTSVIVSWLDKGHPEHKVCTSALQIWAGRDQLGLSSVTYAELAAGARTREGVDEALKAFDRLELDFNAAWRAGQAFRQHRPRKDDNPVLPDFLIRAQAAVLSLQHLTNDHRRLSAWPDVDFLFPDR